MAIAEEYRYNFDEEQLAILDELNFVCRLNESQVAQFASLFRRFGYSVKLEGLLGLEPTKDEKTLIAASCAVMFASRGEWEYPPVRRVAISPHLFNDQFEPDPDAKNILGFFRGGRYPGEGEIQLSRHSIQRAFKDDRDGQNTVIHEFAHALDSDGFKTDGVPLHMSKDMRELWNEVTDIAWKKAGTLLSPLCSYGGTNKQETFAVATEVFFERPTHLEKLAPELYVLMAVYFGQHPALPDRKEDEQSPG